MQNVKTIFPYEIKKKKIVQLQTVKTCDKCDVKVRMDDILSAVWTVKADKRWNGCWLGNNGHHVLEPNVQEAMAAKGAF